VSVDNRIALIKKKLEPAEDSLEAIKKAVQLLRSEISDISNNSSYSVVDTVVSGSASRGTFLPGKIDIDLFIRLRDIRKKEELAGYIDYLIPRLAGRLGIEYILKYAENPYGHLLLPLKKLDLPSRSNSDIIYVDLVATVFTEKADLQKALKISGMARTPFHKEYLSRAITPEKAAEVRLLKYWFKQKRIYGQSSFTGFLTELLIIKYGTFMNVLRNAGEISRLQHDFHGRNISELRKKFNNPRVLITDPTDPERNAAGGISGPVADIKMNRFVEEARKSLAHPETMFDLLIPPSEHVEVIIGFDKNINNVDEVFTRLGRIATRAANQLHQNGYIMKELYIEPENSSFKIILNRYSLDEQLYKGPKETLVKHVERFKNKHDNAFIKDGYVYARGKPKFSTAIEALKHYLKTVPSCKSYRVDYSGKNPVTGKRE